MMKKEQHKTSERSEIYWTKDYSQFAFVKGNRDIQESKVKKLIRSIESGLDLTPYCPIIVSEAMQIIDGQHRFYVCNKLKIPIYYVISNVTTIRQIAEMNSNTDKWKQKDFINCYIDLGFDDYKILHDFKIEYGFSYNSSAQLLQDGCVFDGGSHVGRDINDGKFKVNHYDEITKFAKWYLQLKDHSDKIFNRSLIAAMNILKSNDDFDINILIDRLKSSGRVIELCANKKKYLMHIEELYNYKTRTRIILYK